MYIHTESDNGFINENKLGFSLWGFKYKMLIPEEKKYICQYFYRHKISQNEYSSSLTQSHKGGGEVNS